MDRTIHAPQFHSSQASAGVGGQSGRQDLNDGVRSGGSGDGETSGDDDSDAQSRSDRDGDKVRIVMVTTVTILFIAILVAPPVPTTAPGSRGANVKVDVSGSSPEADIASCPDDDHEPLTENLPTDIAPCPDDDHEPLLTPIDDPQDGAITDPSHAAGVSDVDFDGCNATNGEEVGGRVIFGFALSLEAWTW
ncbi:Hypothetical predicted protein [Olea europaea subsp. europaea]|uniref:Uncharacterized protein n=1 Tax=Olea europaea subsp. europaea TaxID=158383 RepID=A0A8S0QF48_OLEEU|nr:Hypothetical predicted protein [Olea europaea subsp. europaea]